MPDFEDPAIVYGDSVNQLHGECRTRSVLIQFHAPRHTISQTGIIFTSGHRFCCVLTVKNDALKDPNNSITVTFADGNETTVQVSQITLSIGSCLALLEIYDGTYQERPSAVFSEQEAAEDSLVHNLSYAAKITYAYQGTFHAAPVVSYFPGESVSPVGLRHKGMDVFGHNCGAGYPDIIGSSVVNRNGEIVGINVVSSRGSRLALCKAAIRAEIGMLYPGRTGNLTFAAIQQQSKAATEARLASIP